MEREVIKGNLLNLHLIGGLVALLFLLGYAGGTINLEASTFVVALLAIGIAYLATANTYVEIRNRRTLINSGYRTFGKDAVDIFDIKYIYRASAFVWRSGGSLLIVYVKDEMGQLHQVKLRETNYSIENLKKLLLRLKQINSSIELDQEYQDLLAGKLNDPETMLMESLPPSRNTLADLELRLSSRNERWS